VGLDVIALVSEAVAAVDTFQAVKVGRRAEREGEPNFDRDVSRPAPDLAQVDPVVEQAGEKGIPGDLFGN
jgi:hypothetical protein